MEMKTNGEHIDQDRKGQEGSLRSGREGGDKGCCRGKKMGPVLGP